jgi:hypothetical protein
MCVGSVGTVDPRDISKVVFAGSIVQLGFGIGGLETAATSGAVAARVTLFPEVTATIRYAVPPEGVTGVALGELALLLRYRDGDGRVVATLTEVAVPPARPGEPTTVAETPLLQFDSADPSFGGSSQSFRTHVAQLPVPSDLSGHILDFGQNDYYIALSLTGPEVPFRQPPAVSEIGIVGRVGVG